MINLVKELSSTTKRKDKIKILEKYKNNDIVKNIIKYTYHPDYQYYVRKVRIPDRIGDKSIIDLYPNMIDILDRLRNRYYTGHTALNFIKLFMEKLDKDNQDLFKLILTKDLKCGINTKTLNKVFGEGFLPEELIQKADTYKPDKNYGVDYYLASRKLDGVRLRILDNMTCIGRNGKEIKNTEYILNDIRIIRNELDLPFNFFDGEIYKHGWDFNKIFSIISKYKFKNEQERREHDELKKQLYYVIFAIDLDESKGRSINNTNEMLKILNNINNIIKVNNLKHVKIIEYIEIENDFKKIENLMNQFVNEGYEGIMLRHPQIYYEFKRSDKLLKLKPFYEADLKIYDIEIGEITMYENDKPIQVKTVTAVWVEGIAEDNKRKEFVKTRVGSGFSFNDRKMIYENPEKYIGSLIMVKFQNISKDKDGNWSLRFPTFERFRFDKM